MKKVLLYSGGMDSWLIDKIWQPDKKIYINMHTRYSEQEIKKIKALNTDVEIIDFPLGQWERDDKIIPLRNLYLPMVVCNITGTEDVDICLGATAGDRVLDKSKEFVEKANDLLNYLYQLLYRSKNLNFVLNLQLLVLLLVSFSLSPLLFLLIIHQLLKLLQCFHHLQVLILYQLMKH